MLDVKQLGKRYGGVDVLRGVDVAIRAGEIVSVIGPSGAGKSTFLRCLNMLDPPTSGSIRFEGRSLTDPGADLNAVRRRMGMVFQHFNLFSHLDVLRNCTAGPVKLLGLSRADAEARALAQLGTVGLAHRARAYPDELSGGQRQRVAIARCLCMEPAIMLFDEPTSALDPTMVGEVTAVIRNLARDGMTMVIVTHEMEFCRNVSTRVLYMDGGGIYEDGPPDTVFDHPRLPKTRAFVRRLKTFAYTADPAGFDFIDLMNRLANFCRTHRVPPERTRTLELVIEEVVANLLLPRGAATEIVAGFPENQENFEAAFRYGGPPANVLDAGSAPEDAELAQRLVLNLVQKVDHEYADHTNTLRLRW